MLARSAKFRNVQSRRATRDSPHPSCFALSSGMMGNSLDRDDG
jgi:hypothetical protein